MITVAISHKDYLAALRLHRKRAVTRQLFVAAVLAATGAVVFALGYMLVGFVLLSAGAGGLIGELVESKLILPRRAEKIYHQQASLRATYTYSWDNGGLSVSSEMGQARRPWSDYTKFLEDDQLFLLYHSDIMFEIFPKSWFTSQEQADEFRALVSQVGA